MAEVTQPYGRILLKMIRRYINKSEEYKMSEVLEEVHELPEGAYINIDITETNVKYDTNLTVPEVVFWLRVVETMAMKKVLGDE